MKALQTDNMNCLMQPLGIPTGRYHARIVNVGMHEIAEQGYKAVMAQFEIIDFERDVYTLINDVMIIAARYKEVVEYGLKKLDLFALHSGIKYGGYDTVGFDIQFVDADDLIGKHIDVAIENSRGFNLIDFYYECDEKVGYMQLRGGAA